MKYYRKHTISRNIAPNRKFYFKHTISIFVAISRKRKNLSQISHEKYHCQDQGKKNFRFQKRLFVKVDQI